MSDPRITGEAVEAGTQAYERGVGPGVHRMEDMVRAILEAAAPLLAPQPVVDREVLAEELAAHVWQSTHHEGYLWAGCSCGWEDLGTGHLDRSTWRTHQLDAVLALLNGSTK